MSYKKVILYGDLIELYEYENEKLLTAVRRGTRKPKDSGLCSDISFDGTPIQKQEKPRPVRTKENARRSVLAFRRLISANLGGFNNPILASLTYAENMQDYNRARKDFNLFTKRLQFAYSSSTIKFITVTEFQKRGSIHFHTLIWGLPTSLVEEERSTRKFAGLWGHGFVDLVNTDGSHKLATYLSKYMAKAFLDPRLFGKKVYTSSHNITRPFVDKNAILESYYYGFRGVDLSTALLLQDKEYMTQWLGKGRYRIYKLVKPIQ